MSLLKKVKQNKLETEKEVALETPKEVALETPKEVASKPKKEATSKPKKEVALETTSVNPKPEKAPITAVVEALKEVPSGAPTLEESILVCEEKGYDYRTYFRLTYPNLYK